MAYTKTVWTNREVEKPRTYTSVTNADGTITLTPAEGAVYTAGTPIDATVMNNIENGIADVDANKLSKSGGTMTGDVDFGGNDITKLGSLAFSNLGADGKNWMMIENGEKLEFRLYTGTTNEGAKVTIGTAGDIIGAGYWKVDNSNYIRQEATGRVLFFAGGVIKHTFNADGTKVGGTIEVDGVNYGMSPIDSPQILLEFIVFGIELTPEGTRVEIDPTFLKTVEHFAVFPNRGEIIEKGADYFIISGEGVADCRVVGERVGYAGRFYEIIESEEPENGTPAT